MCKNLRPWVKLLINCPSSRSISALLSKPSVIQKSFGNPKAHSFLYSTLVLGLKYNQNPTLCTFSGASLSRSPLHSSLRRPHKLPNLALASWPPWFVLHTITRVIFTFPWGQRPEQWSSHRLPFLAAIASSCGAGDIQVLTQHWLEESRPLSETAPPHSRMANMVR